MLYKEDTISALSTPIGTGGISIIRISGPESFRISNGIFQGKVNIDEMADHTIQYGKIIDNKSNEIIDEVMITKMKAPATYTKEDVVEINCHGSLAAVRRILELVYRNGARPAEPGEFTKRAFLNGRIDLVQAEAVIDVINSRTEQGRKAAIDLMGGRLSEKLNKYADILLNILARIEVTVDYPEHDDEFETSIIAIREIEEIISGLDNLLKSYDAGKIIKSGINTVLVGNTNVGKSTLMNELAGFNKAIVTDIPGTTRDVVEEEVNIDGILFNVKDTAGIRETSDLVEKIGVEKARKEINNADLIIFIIDVANTSEINIDLINDVLNAEGKKLFVLNKIDICDKEIVEDIENSLKKTVDNKSIKIVKTALINGDGAVELRNEIKEMFNTGDLMRNNEIIVTSERQRNNLYSSVQSLKAAAGSVSAGMPLDMISIDIKNSLEYIGIITGRSIDEELVDTIFSSFCLGK